MNEFFSIERTPTIHIIGPRDVVDTKSINVTSHSTDFGKELSPFLLGPIDLYNGYISKNMENAWQYSKVYRQHTDSTGEPTEEYFKWASYGWKSDWAHRYPMGKGNKPEYSWWKGKKMSYLEARKRIYCPLYASAIENTSALKKLKEMYSSGKDLWLWDFDGYDHISKGMTYRDVINNDKRPMGHAFVIAMVIENKGEWEND